MNESKKKYNKMHALYFLYYTLILVILQAPFGSLCMSVSAARSKSMVLGELSRVSRPCSPLDQEKALKAGWLKRQRSIMKNWQLRWFVLRTEALYFYKDQDETKAQVKLTKIHIQDCSLLSVASGCSNAVYFNYIEAYSGFMNMSTCL